MSVYSPEYVEAPPQTPAPFGLFTPALVLNDLTGHRQLGVEYEPESCGRDVYETPAACYEAGDEKTATDGIPLIAGLPYVAYHLFTCRAPAGGWQNAEGRAKRALELGEEYAAELHLAGMLPLDPDAVDLTPTPGTAVTAAHGIALLEAYARAHYAGQAVIHVPVLPASLLATDNAIEADSGQMKTKLGTRIAVGAGYAELAGPAVDDDEDPETPDEPVEAGDGEAWLWATGQVVVRRAPEAETAGPTLNTDPRDNELTLLVERPTVITYECFAAAVLVSVADLAGIDGGGA